MRVMRRGTRHTGSDSFMVTVALETLALLRTFTRLRQFTRSTASSCSSSHEAPLGTSINRSPVVLYSEMKRRAFCTNLSASIRKMWTTHANRLDLIHRTMSNDRVTGLASSCGVLFVMRAIMWLLAQFSMVHVRSSSCQVSEPYVSSEQTPDL